MKTSAIAIWAGIFACASAIVSPAATKPGILWETKRFAAEHMDINDVASNSSGYIVAVGTAGLIRTSDDHGASWIIRNSNAPFDLYAVEWNGSHWIAVGGYHGGTSLILTSSDGANWTTTCLGGSPSLHGIASGASASVAVGRHEFIARSDDLVLWQTQTENTFHFADVVWTGSQFVAVGEHGLVKTSPDGTTWTPRTNGLADNMYLNSVAWNGTLLVAGGEDFETGAPLILTSGDGIDWAAPSMAGFPDFHIEAVEWTGSAFVAMGDNGHTLVSTDGAAWSHHLAPGGIDVRGLCRDGDHHLVAVGRNGGILETTENIPDDESDWTVLADPVFSKAFSDVAEGDVEGTHRAVVVGLSGTVLSSDDGFETIITQTSGTGSSLYGITATSLSATRFIAVGAIGTILTSPDAATWTSKTSGVGAALRSVAWFEPFGFASSFAIAVGDDGTILKSSDATTWTSQSSPTTEDLKSVAVGNVYVKPTGLVKRAVAVGDNGTILYSANGTTWKAANDPGTTEVLYSVAALERGFIAVGYLGTILTSSNGIDWSIQTNGSTSSLLDAVWTGEQIVTVGESGAIFTSPAGAEWTRRYGPGITILFGVTKLNSGRLVAVGNDGLIAVSDPAPDFGDWLAAQSPPAGQDGPDDDPNGDGVTNLLAYGLGIPAVAPTTPEDLEALPRINQAAPDTQPALLLRIAPVPLPDLAYILETSETLEPGSWTEAMRHLPGQLCGSGALQLIIPNGPNCMAVVFPENFGDHPHFFTRLRVELTE